jgi:hypothetical protein
MRALLKSTMIESFCYTRYWFLRAVNSSLVDFVVAIAPHSFIAGTFRQSTHVCFAKSLLHLASDIDDVFQLNISSCSVSLSLVPHVYC